MIRLILFFIFSMIAFLLTCRPKKESLRTYLICILVMNVIGMFEVSFLHAVNQGAGMIPYVVTCLVLAVQWRFLKIGLKPLEGIITIYTVLIFFFSVI